VPCRYRGNEVFLSPASGFVWFEPSWSEPRELVGYGDVACVTETTIQLRPRMMYPELCSGPRRASMTSGDLYYPLPSEVLCIKWGQRHYLARPDDMRELADYHGCDPWEHLVNWVREVLMLRKGDERYPVSGWPELPPEYRSYVPPEPRYARVVAVHVTRWEPEWYTEEPDYAEYLQRQPHFQIRVSLDKGTEDGVGLEMRLQSLAADLESAEVTEISPTSSVAEYWTEGFAGERPIVPQPGWLFALPDGQGDVKVPRACCYIPRGPEPHAELRLYACDADDLHGDDIKVGSPEDTADLDASDEPTNWVSWTGSRLGWVSWTVEFEQTGTYAVTGRFAAASGGTELIVRAGNQEIVAKVPKTAKWGDFQSVHIGELEFTHAGVYTISVRARDERAWKPVRLKRLELQESR
jgi:hypothetical protein